MQSRVPGGAVTVWPASSSPWLTAGGSSRALGCVALGSHRLGDLNTHTHMHTTAELDSGILTTQREDTLCCVVCCLHIFSSLVPLLYMCIVLVTLDTSVLIIVKLSVLH